MSILVDRNTRVICQGLGKAGTFHAIQCREYGTRWCGGISPGKGSASWVSVSNTGGGCAKTRPMPAWSSSPPPRLTRSEADAGIKVIVAITAASPSSTWPASASTKSRAYADRPKLPGVITPGQCIGIMPGTFTSPGGGRHQPLRHTHLRGRVSAHPWGSADDVRRHRWRPGDRTTRSSFEVQKDPDQAILDRRDRRHRGGAGGGVRRREREEVGGGVHRRANGPARPADGPRGGDHLGREWVGEGQDRGTSEGGDRGRADASRTWDGGPKSDGEEEVRQFTTKTQRTQRRQEQGFLCVLCVFVVKRTYFSFE